MDHDRLTASPNEPESSGNGVARSASASSTSLVSRVAVRQERLIEEVSKAHAEVFSEIRPANTTVVTQMVDPAWKLEIDADALLP